MKKTLSIILAILILFSTSIFVFAQEEGSSASLPAESKWASEYVKKAQNVGITEKGKYYRYLHSITREEFCELIYNYYNIVRNEEISENIENKFTDTDNIHIAFLNKLGIIEGKSENEFAPNDLLTREESATIIFRLINTVHPDWAVHELWFEFSDNDEISDWAMNDIQRICNMGIMNGTGNGKFAPKSNLTTQQAIVMLVRVYDSFVKNNKLDFSELSFADKLNAQMPASENYMFSPLSIKTALMLSANGATGETKEEILNALGIESIDDFNEFSKDLLKRYSQTDILSLNVANSIWINKDKTTQSFSENFKSIAGDFYNADVKTVNNKNAVSEINSWVSDKTNGKISEIVGDTGDFWSMIVNAVYFKGRWQNEFKKSATEEEEFTNADGTKAKTDFMNKNAWIKYAETKSVKIVELPYKNREDKFNDEGEYIDSKVYDNLDVSMYLIASDNDINVAQELEATIKDELFKNTYIKLSLPKFKFEYSQNLNDILKNTGIKTALDTKKADFTKMFDSGNMWFTDVLHKTYISVDEEGTEAAAVTSVGMGGSSLPPEPVEIKFNKPFYFVIRDNTSGEILFMGRYACVK